MKITKTLCKKVLKVVDCGLSSGLGNPIPGQMCVEAAVNFALGAPHGDNPGCVHPTLRAFKIALNDKNWSSNQARAKGLRRIAIAQLGTKDTLDGAEFLNRLSKSISKILPKTLRLVAEMPELANHKARLLAAALVCEQEGTKDAAYAAASAAYAAAAYAANAAARDNALADFAEDVVQILIKMGTPGSKFLAITED